MCPLNTKERQLFLTDEYKEFDLLEDALTKCYVIPCQPKEQLAAWLSISPWHFYFIYRAQSLESVLQAYEERFEMCGLCVQQQQELAKKYHQYTKGLQSQPMRVLDPFAGSGAFALGMCSTGAMKFTHAIEIESSAARSIG